MFSDSAARRNPTKLLGKSAESGCVIFSGGAVIRCARSKIASRGSDDSETLHHDGADADATRGFVTRRQQKLSARGVVPVEATGRRRKCRGTGARGEWRGAGPERPRQISHVRFSETQRSSAEASIERTPSMPPTLVSIAHKSRSLMHERPRSRGRLHLDLVAEPRRPQALLQRQSDQQRQGVRQTLRRSAGPCPGSRPCDPFRCRTGW